MHVLLRQCLLALALCGAVLTYSAPVLADISRGEAASKAKKAHGGKVLNVTKVSSKNGKTTYRVKLLLDGGRVKTVTVSG